MAASNDHRQLVERYIAAYRSADVSQLDQIIAPNFIDHSHPDFSGPEGVAAGVRHLHSGLSDIEVDLEFVVCDGDSAAFLVKASGTHTGEFAGKPPCGERVIWRLADFVRIRDGKISEMWN